MTENESDADDTGRVTAWADEMRAVHDRLRQAMVVARDAIDADDPRGEPSRDLLLYCHGFCTALSGHHTSEDNGLFPAIAEKHPELMPTLQKLKQDHDMIGTLVAQMATALENNETPERVRSHLDGLAAIMDSHFAFEERELLSVLDTLGLEADRDAMLGPL